MYQVYYLTPIESTTFTLSLELMLKFPRLAQTTKDPGVTMRALKKSLQDWWRWRCAFNIRRSKDKPITEEDPQLIWLGLAQSTVMVSQ